MDTQEIINRMYTAADLANRGGARTYGEFKGTNREVYDQLRDMVFDDNRLRKLTKYGRYKTDRLSDFLAEARASGARYA